VHDDSSSVESCSSGSQKKIDVYSRESFGVGDGVQEAIDTPSFQDKGETIDV
jgi:hypothetical protein